jgi:CheY-like chemotaxis protein
MNKNLVVFLIDDDTDDQLFFEMAISEIALPVDCFFASDGIQALKMLVNPEFSPDFILLDINMPKMNGKECLMKIREIKRLDDVPVYMYSTSFDKSIEENFLKLGAAGLLKKQTSISEISKELMYVFHGKLASH